MSTEARAVTRPEETASEALAILIGTGRWTLSRTTDGGMALRGPDDLTMTRSEIVAVTSLTHGCGWRRDMDLHRVQTLTWVRRTDV